MARGFSELGLRLAIREVTWEPLGSAVSQTRERRRALVVECTELWQSLSWAAAGGGRERHSRYVCAEVRNADLPLGVEPRAVCAAFLSRLDSEAAVVALTSADVGQYRAAFARESKVCAAVVVTAGLANALRVGEPSANPPRRYLPDTINLACWVNVPLTFEAELEALSIVTQARTLEVLEAKVPSLDENGWATGTGTDCITLFSALEREHEERTPHPYAGMHTSVGRVLGVATRKAVGAVVDAWLVNARAKATLTR